MGGWVTGTMLGQVARQPGVGGQARARAGNGSSLSEARRSTSQQPPQASSWAHAAACWSAPAPPGAPHLSSSCVRRWRQSSRPVSWPCMPATSFCAALVANKRQLVSHMDQLWCRAGWSALQRRSHAHSDSGWWTAVTWVLQSIRLTARHPGLLPSYIHPRAAAGCRVAQDNTFLKKGGAGQRRPVQPTTRPPTSAALTLSIMRSSAMPACSACWAVGPGQPPP